MADPAMPKTGDLIAAKYRIEQLIGVGGMGAVFSATHQYTGKRVALKWMLPELAKDEDAVQRFLREARAAGRISHPNVVDVYDVGQHDESYFLVMEYLQGEPLTSALARRDLTPTEVLTLLLPAMRGVAAAHRQGVVHRDLKPDNIFLAYEEDGVRREAKVLDFGISKLAADDQPSMHLTRTGAVIGTPFYMSPEQIRGKGGIDRRSDVYAFGVILYEALGGQVPFSAETYGALVLEIATGTPKPLQELVPNLPLELSRIVLRAMAREVGDRYPTMEDLVAAVEPFSRPSMSGALWRTSQRAQSTSAVRQHFEEPRRAPTPAGLPAPYPTPAPVPAPDTKPFRASTPFAAEGSRSLPPPRSGMSAARITGFVAAAVAIVGAIWWLTRDPAVEPVVGTGVVTPPLAESKSAASAEPPPVDDIPRGVSPGAAIVPTGNVAQGADNVVPTGVGAEPEKVPSQVDQAPVVPVRPSGTTRRDSARSSAQSRKPAEERRGPSPVVDPPAPSPTPTPTVQPVAPEAQRQTPQQRARSGTLNVNEF